MESHLGTDMSPFSLNDFSVRKAKITKIKSTKSTFNVRGTRVYKVEYGNITATLEQTCHLFIE